MQARLRQARGVGVTQTRWGVGGDRREWWFAVAIYAEPNRDLKWAVKHHEIEHRDRDEREDSEI